MEKERKNISVSDFVYIFRQCMTYMYKTQLKEECEFEYAQARTVLM